MPMPKTANVTRVKDSAQESLFFSRARYEDARFNTGLQRSFVAWVAAMTAVEVYATWERYAEERLTIALSNHPEHFLKEKHVRGVTKIPLGLATTLILGRNKYFDFRSTDELIKHGKTMVGTTHNPFDSLRTVKNYLDALSAIRNYIVHQSESALKAYKDKLSTVYGMKHHSFPTVFLNSIDRRGNSPARNEPRIIGLITTVENAVTST